MCQTNYPENLATKYTITTFSFYALYNSIILVFTKALGVQEFPGMFVRTPKSNLIDKTARS
jgi:hypothetical protein